MDNILASYIGPDIVDLDQEIFTLFSEDIPSNNLGFVAKTDSVTLEIGGRDYELNQSPSLLYSKRKEGTTGAVLWQVTPRFAEWIQSADNFLFQLKLLGQDSNVLELGCGISGLLGLVVSARVKTYFATDQSYVLKVLRRNVASNPPQQQRSKTSTTESNVIIKELDWETDSVARLYDDLGLTKTNDHINAIIACDCIYNEPLVDPFVSTCVEICKLAPKDKPTLCIIAQQLRSSEVFEVWIKAFHENFHVWSLRSTKYTCSQDLGENSGFVVHLGILRS